MKEFHESKCEPRLVQGYINFSVQDIRLCVKVFKTEMGFLANVTGHLCYFKNRKLRL